MQRTRTRWQVFLVNHCYDWRNPSNEQNGVMDCKPVATRQLMALYVVCGTWSSTPMNAIPDPVEFKSEPEGASEQWIIEPLGKPYRPSAEFCQPSMSTKSRRNKA
jgi:hypothetical protein